MNAGLMESDESETAVGGRREQSRSDSDRSNRAQCENQLNVLYLKISNSINVENQAA